MSIVIVGCRGQLGQAFMRRLGDKAVGLSRDELDLTRGDVFRSRLEPLKPAIVINCAAYNWVDQAETDPGPAFAVNAWGVDHLAEVCDSLGAVLVHYSTNYVFGLDATRRLPYVEGDLPGPVSLYAASKLAGEYLVRARTSRHFVIRTAAVFGAGEGRRNFVDLMLQLAEKGQTIRVVNDQTISPTCTTDLVESTLRLLETDRFGLYHLTCTGACTWHDYAREVFSQAGIKADLRAVTSPEFGAPARRPTYSVLANDAYDRLSLPPLRHWRDALIEYLAQEAK